MKMSAPPPPDLRSVSVTSFCVSSCSSSCCCCCLDAFSSCRSTSVQHINTRFTRTDVWIPVPVPESAAAAFCPPDAQRAETAAQSSLQHQEETFQVCSQSERWFRENIPLSCSSAAPASLTACCLRRRTRLSSDSDADRHLTHKQL